jgi:hypothetical protein
MQNFHAQLGYVRAARIWKRKQFHFYAHSPFSIPILKKQAAVDYGNLISFNRLCINFVHAVDESDSWCGKTGNAATKKRNQ